MTYARVATCRIGSSSAKTLIAPVSAQSSFRKAAAVAAFTLVTLVISGASNAQTICPDPAKPCGSFKPYELPFRIPKSGAAKAEDRSEFFYAIILKSAAHCSIADDERTTAQQLFASNKVFVSRFECDPEDNVNYTTIDQKYSILAVYGGKSLAEAKAFLETVRKTGRFPGAYPRKMRAVLVHP
ncbi:MAG TPA: hypothetical protein VFV34_28030 [Blastocatellia bacterium]|nr:hypothetical protein [Blastocatellia bacterium]